MQHAVAAAAGALAVLALFVPNDEMRAQDARDPSIPEVIHDVAEKIGAAGLTITRTPGDSNGNFVVRVEFPPERQGFKACPDHYPPYFVPVEAVCPSLDDGASPAPGWTACHALFYAPEEIGCPAMPQTPIAPATIPRPRCDFGPERCALETPGGPVLIRGLQVGPNTQAIPILPVDVARGAFAESARAADPVTAERAAPIAAERAAPIAAERAAPIAAERAAPIRIGRAGPIAVERAGPVAVERAAPVAVERAGPVAVERAAPVAVERAPIDVQRAGRVAAAPLDAVRARPEDTVADTVRLEQVALRSRRLAQLRDLTSVRAELRCADGQCEWGGTEALLTLPTPPVTPVGHVPCEYEHVSFYVPENRFCPSEESGERPAPGTSLYMSWSPDGSASPRLYYYRSDADGIPLTLMQIFGDSDDRYSIREATERERTAARSTAMLIKNENLSPAEGGFITLEDDPAWRPLCSDERFVDLPQPGRCSGVKIGDRLVATSAHCVRSQRQCADTSAVFGFFGEAASGVRTAPAASVYQCTSIVASRRPATIGERGADWTIFEVDRDIDAPTAALAPSSDVRQSVVTTVIGHPLGLPAIVTRFGVVQAVATEYFIANSDTFVGNSGSAVFAAQSVEDDTPRVLGLLTGGGYDFVETVQDGQACVQAKWCRGPECLGDDVVYADDLIEALPARGPAEQ